MNQTPIKETSLSGYRAWIYRGLFLLVLPTIGVISSCVRERTIEPISSSARAYVTSVNLPPTLYIFDTETDSLLDSLRQPLFWGDFLINADPDAPRFATSHFLEAQLYQAAGPEPYTTDSIPTVTLAFDTKRNLLLGSGGGHGTVAPPVFASLNPDDLSVLHIDTFGLGEELRLDRRSGLAYGITYIRVGSRERELPDRTLCLQLSFFNATRLLEHRT